MNGEDKKEIIIKIRWRDCFKFWISGFVFLLILQLAILLTVMALLGKILGGM